MCGIAGVLQFANEEAPTAPAGAPDRALDRSARAMAEALRHRGPDRLNTYASPTGACALGHSRLRVIDLETGDQPLGNEDGSVQVVFNGEIYNFQDLRTELARAGHRFRTRSDTEVVVHGYEQWGPDVVRHLDGMFAFGLWDERQRRLLLARDRAGKKPLFIHRSPGRLAFASEIGALQGLPDFDDRLRPDGVPLYLLYGYVPAPDTLFESVKKLPPAHWLLIDAEGSERQERYWELDWTPRWRERGATLEAVRARLTEAVEKRLVADVPLGAFLSGGVDSTLVVALMSRAGAAPVRTFSIGFEDDPSYDETAYARMAADSFGTHHTEFRVPASSVDLLDDLLDAYDEPFGDSSAIPTYIVSRLTRDHVTVALTGDGGDEMFAGYPRFLGNVVASYVPGWTARLGRRLARQLPHNPDFRSVSRRLQRFTEAAALEPHERMLRWIGFFADRLEEVLAPEALDGLCRDELTRSVQEPLRRARSLSPLGQALALNFATYLPEDLLVKADRCSMAHGLELRSPFLDTALMELAAGVTDRQRLRRGRLKALLKDAFADVLPAPIRDRRKMGFGVPLPTWLRGAWRPLVEERLLHPEAKVLGWLRPEPLRRMAEEHWTGRHDHGHALWALLTLEGWLGRARYTR